MSAAPPRVHRNLIWLRADPAALDLLAADPQVARLLLARPAPGIAAVRPADQERLGARLTKLGHVPRIVGKHR